MYPGADPNSNEICSTTYKCRKNPENIYDAPDGQLGVSFDDGPLPVRLVDCTRCKPCRSQIQISVDIGQTL